MKYHKKYFLLFFLLLLIAGTVYPQTAREIDSREFKLLLKGELFNNRISGAENIWKQIKSYAEKSNYKVTEADNTFSESIRDIIFIDTKNLDFFKKDLILRKRTKYSGSKPGSDYEITVKLRVSDKKDAEKKEITTHEGLKTKSKFEEDIGMKSGETGSIVSVYSLSTSIKKISFESGNKVEDIYELFPSLKETGINPEEEIKTVNDIIIKEYLYEPGEIKFGTGLKVQAEITVWYKKGEENPFIAEFSYKDKSVRKNVSDETRKASEEFFKGLQSVLKESIHNGFTKTKIIYGVTD